jgi:gentisate 1,2-dioxygenase
MKKHDHIHLVVPIRGSGSCLVDAFVINLDINNVIHVPSWSWHQFKSIK